MSCFLLPITWMTIYHSYFRCLSMFIYIYIKKRKEIRYIILNNEFGLEEYLLSKGVKKYMGNSLWSFRTSSNASRTCSRYCTRDEHHTILWYSSWHITLLQFSEVRKKLLKDGFEKEMFPHWGRSCHKCKQSFFFISK